MECFGCENMGFFKTHFRESQTELREIGGPTIEQAGFHHTNMLAS